MAYIHILKSIFDVSFVNVPNKENLAIFDALKQCLCVGCFACVPGKEKYKLFINVLKIM